MKFTLIFALLLTFLLPTGAAGATGAAPIHVCGIVTDYFVDDLPSGGRIEIDGKNYPIASSASYRRTQPLPEVTIGSDVCLNGTTNDAGDLLDFTVTPRATPSPTTSSTTVPATTTEPSPPSGVPGALVLGLAALALLAAAGLVLARRGR